jgi:hypothetical protein
MSIRRPDVRAAAGIAAACLLLIVTACAGDPPPPPPQSAPVTAGSPDGLERYYRQSVAWEACDGYAGTASAAAPCS